MAVDVHSAADGRGSQSGSGTLPGREGAYLLTSRSDLAQFARDAADCAMRAGAAQVIASATEKAGVVMKARSGAFESAVKEGAQSLSIRVFDAGRTATVSTSALTPEAIRLAVERAMAIAGEVEPDLDAAPPESSWLARNGPSVELFSQSRFTPEDLGRTALEIEAAVARHGGPTVRVAEAGAASVEYCFALAIGRDFDRSDLASRHDIWCRAIAQRGNLLTQDWWSSSDRRPSQLLTPSAVGAMAADRAVRKLGGRTLETRTCPVLLDAVVASTLVDEVAAALSGRAQFQQATFLAGGKGTQALADHLDLVEDPLEPFGLASGAYDSEGVAGVPRHIIREGMVEDYFLSCLYARKLGLRPTGNADGVRNLTLSSRRPRDTLAGLLRQMNRGLWVTELIGGAVDPVSGAYSKAAAGFWIENGEVAFPVQDVTIAGELPAMLAGIVAVGSDVHRRGAIRTGSIFIESMRISGR